MPATGVLINARAGRVKRDPGLIERLRARLPAGRLRVTSGVADIEPALRDLRELGIDTLVVVGGDGTVGATLTALLRVWTDEPRPAIALAAGGTVNTIPRSLGRGEPTETLVERLLSDAPPRQVSVRAAVHAQPENGEARYGMIFGNGVTTRWLETYYANRSQGPWGAVQVIGRAVGSALRRGELARQLFEPFRAKCEVDGKLLELEQFTIMGAAGVRDVGLGFRPFLTAGENPQRIHFLATDASAPRIAAELPGLWLGLHGSVFQHFSAARVSIRFEKPEPWSVDADLFPPTLALGLRPSPPLRFIAP